MEAKENNITPSVQPAGQEVQAEAKKPLEGKTVAQKRGHWLSLIQSLAGSQGMYSRLWANIHELGSDSDEVQNWLSQFDDCNDDIEFILRYEG